jgi:hypothetical protein
MGLWWNLVYTTDLKSVAHQGLRVQISPAPPFKNMKPLSKTSKYLKNKKKAKEILLNTVITSSKIEGVNLTKKDLYKQSLKRPKNFEKLSPREQWGIDKELGILDWDGEK